MGRIQTHRLADPDETVRFPLGMSQTVRLGGFVVGRDTHEPGWHWRDHIRPIVGTEWCQFHHRGIVVSGHMGVRMDDGEERVIGPDEVFDVPPGHDGWVVGDSALVTFEWAGVEGWASPPEGQRVVATLLFTDIVKSTERLQQLGDAAWKHVAALHDQTVRMLLETHRGKEIETAGDSFLAVFDGAARALRCGRALATALTDANVPIRVAVHTGEIEYVGTQVRGVAVHVAARVLGLAGPGEVLVSSTTRELVEGSGLQFASRGRHRLKGLDSEREIFELVGGAP